MSDNYGKQNGRFSQNGADPRSSTGRNANYLGMSGYGDDEIDLKQLFNTLFRYKWSISAFVAGGLIISIFFALYLTPIYQSSGMLMIKDNQSQSPFGEEGLASMMSSSFGIGMGSSLSNEIQILKSRSLSYELADQLLDEKLMPNGRQYPLIWKGYGDDSTAADRDTVALRIREGLGVSLVDREADMIDISFESPSPYEAATIVNKAMETYSSISTEQNRSMAQSAQEFLEDEKQKVEERLINFEDQLQNFMDENRLVQVDAQTEELIKRISELESEKESTRVKLVAVNSAIDQYEERLNEIKPGLADQYADAIAPTITKYQYQISELKTEKMLIISKNPGLEENPDRAPQLQAINREIAALEKEIRDLTNRLIQQNDTYLSFMGDAGSSISENLTQIHQKLIELKVEQSQYQSQLEVLNERLAEQEQFFNQLPENMIRLARLKRDVKVNEELFLTLQQQEAEMALWEQTQFGKGRIIDEGFVPEKPISPKKRLIVLVGLILGGVLGIGYVFVRESFNTKIDGTEKLKKKGYPILSVVPDLSVSESKDLKENDTISVQGTSISTSLVTVLDSISPVAESFRRLQGNILYSRPDTDFSVLMVTSSTKGEGKSTVASNLSVALAEANRKVLLLDLDLRRPNVHNMFGKLAKPGIVEAIFGEIALEEAIQNTIVDRVDVLTCGRRPPNPSGLLQSDKLNRMIDELKKDYDHIILDTPPFGIIMDSASLVKHSDGVIVVSRFNRTDEGQLDHTIENLELINAEILGMVLTAFDYTKSSDMESRDYFKNAYRDYRSYIRDKDKG